MPYKDPEKRREYHRNYMQRWYDENTGKHVGYVRNKESKAEEWIREYKSGKTCERCGEEKVELLELYIGERRLSTHSLKKYISMEKLNNVLDRCSILCKSCQVLIPSIRPASRIEGGKMRAIDKKKVEQLGMSMGTATHRLRKMVLFELLKRYKENICFRCGKEINDLLELTIEHKEPWLHVSPDLFWDVSNIAFSHSRCNRPDRPVYNKKRKEGPQGTAWCSGCKSFKVSSMFRKSKKHWNGFHENCKDCMTMKHRNWLDEVLNGHHNPEA
jgi:hypothetical protein